VEDLQAAVAEVKSAPEAEGGMAPVYGMAATLPLRGVVRNILKAYMDVLYKT
jgi:sphinganine-1-phosphate aldolase